MAKRIGWLDIAKGICMLAVIGGHFGIININKVVFSFHLAVFFILSGYTLKKDMSATSVAKKFGRMMVPYFVTCLAVAIMDVVNLILIHKQTSIAAVTSRLYSDILRTFMGSGAFTAMGSVNMQGRIGAIWFLPAMFFALLLTQLLLNYVTSTKARYAAAISMALVGFISARYIWFPFSMQSALFAVPFVLIGYDVKNKGIVEKIRFKHFAVSAVVFVAGVYMDVTSVSFVSAYVPDILLTPIFSLASSLCIVYISKKTEFIKPLAFIGRYSMYYLCLHLFELETMGHWFTKLLGFVNLPVKPAYLFVVRVVFGTVGTFCILYAKKLYAYLVRPREIQTGGRDVTLDIAKALLISLMVFAHVPINPSLRSLIYSFHMVGFIILLGYMFRQKACDTPFRSVLKLCRAFLIPYLLFAVIFVLTREGELAFKIKTVLFGISFTKNFFTDIPMVGPMYFVLLLFGVRLVYLFVAKLLKDDWLRSAAVLVLSLVGFYMGRKGCWLPWSFDVALYSLVFYHIGYLIKKYDLLEYLCKRPHFYFLLAVVWGYMVWAGSMELATRAYGVYGTVVVGATCATLLVYMLSRYITRVGGKILTSVLAAIGKNTMYILLVHTLFSNEISQAVIKLTGLTPGFVYHFAVIIAVNLLLGTLIGITAKLVTRQAARLYNYNKKGA